MTKGISAMDTMRIGKAAGTLWEFVSWSGPKGATLSSVKRIRGLSSDEAVAAVGWLAREGKVSFTGKRRVHVTLVESECREPRE